MSNSGYAWFSGSPASRYGGSFLSSRADPAAAAAAMTPSATAPAGSAHRAWHWDSPLFWIGALILGAVGLAGASTTVRVGPAKAGLELGKP
jgi:hypothetical protein